MKIAIYSANYGNYRNEINNGIDFVTFDSNIDYYFFTDNRNIKSKKWNMMYTDCQSSLDFIDKYRHTSKHSKFVVPSILHTYDIIVWIDSKTLKRLNFVYDKIIKVVDNDKLIYFIKHLHRYSPEQELNITIRRKMENHKNGLKLLDEIKNIKFNSHLPETMCIIYKNINDPLDKDYHKTIDVLDDIYSNIINKGILRDQNIIQYVLKNNDFEQYIGNFSIKQLLK